MPRTCTWTGDFEPVVVSSEPCKSSPHWVRDGLGFIHNHCHFRSRKIGEWMITFCESSFVRYETPYLASRLEAVDVEFGDVEDCFVNEGIEFTTQRRDVIEGLVLELVVRGGSDNNAGADLRRRKPDCKGSYNIAVFSGAICCDHVVEERGFVRRGIFWPSETFEIAADVFAGLNLPGVRT